MSRFAFAIDNRKCIGCHACTVACKSEHDVPIGVNRTWVKYIEKGAFPDTRRSFSVQRCNHCEDAPCVEICPVTSLYTRPDGIVDFDIDRCIGCKACMQACPYDALYINPDTNTVGKCNYCTHRVDQGIEPACVVVCPVEAIGSGDLDDPNSPISILDRTQRVQYPKIEKNTKPKLFYIGGETAAINPTEAPPKTDYLWSSSGKGISLKQLNVAEQETQDRARRVYDVGPKDTGWGWMVSAYVTTKAIAAGAVMVSYAAFWRHYLTQTLSFPVVFIAMLFLGLTGALLVFDLKQPMRFLNVLLRPQWKSWLVRGAYFITAFGGLLLSCGIITGLVDGTSGGGRTTHLILGGVTSMAALLTAIYTAFLFAQARGRDYWQNPLLVVEMGLDSLVAGAATLALVAAMGASSLEGVPWSYWLGWGIVALAAITVADFVPRHQTRNAELTAKSILSGEFRWWFWGGAIGAGLFLPAVLLLSGGSVTLTALLVLAGISAKAHVLVQAPQRIPLS